MQVQICIMSDGSSHANCFSTIRQLTFAQQSGWQQSEHTTWFLLKSQLTRTVSQEGFFTDHPMPHLHPQQLAVLLSAPFDPFEQAFLLQLHWQQGTDWQELVHSLCCCGSAGIFLCLQKSDKEPQSGFDLAVNHSVLLCTPAVGQINLGCELTSEVFVS